METVWYIILLAVVCIYFLMDGYDFGVGVIHLFVPKTEKEKKLVAKAAGFYWDFNEVWLVVAGGLLFMAFPIFYASLFSGFYLPLMILLWLMIFRALGIELRHQFNHPIWTKFWDKSFGVSSLLLTLFFGAALGNMIRGVNFGQNVNDLYQHESHLFFLPLWNSTFSPIRPDVGVLDWFTFIIGILALLILTIHGGNWIVLKTQSNLNPKIKKNVYRLNFVLLVFLIISVLVWGKVSPTAFQSFLHKPWLLIFPIIFLVGFIGTFWVRKNKKEIWPFVFSSFMIVGGILASLVPRYPVLLPSNNTENSALTIYNTATGSYASSTALIWMFFAVILAASYFLLQHRIMAGKIDEKVKDFDH